MPYGVRDAKRSDVIDIVEMGERLHEESVFRCMSFDKERVARLVLLAVNGRDDNLFIKCVEDIETHRVVGGLFAWTQVSWFGPDRVANDVTLMVDAPHRDKCFSQLVKIVSMYKEWAISRKAKLIHLSTSTQIDAERTGKIYEALGFPKSGSIHTVIVQ